ncbi:hypothetical protein YC2023_107127 [Brassica napus]
MTVQTQDKHSGWETKSPCIVLSTSIKTMTFGKCPRVYCCGQPCLPVGQSDLPRLSTLYKATKGNTKLCSKSFWVQITHAVKEVFR